MGTTQTIREQLTYKAILQITFILIAVLLTIFYTQPKLAEVNDKVAQANITLENYKKLNENGIEFNVLKNKIKTVGWYESLIALIDENIEEANNQPKDISEDKKMPEVKNIIKKEGNDPYLTWLTSVSNSTTEEKEKIKIEKSKINTILPTLSPITDSTNEESVTLRNYIAYVEQNILKKYNILSFSPLGITGINYNENQKDSKNPIGNFQLELNFNTSSDNVAKLIEYIKTSGKPDILDKNYNWTIAGIMSNPLITIDSLSVNDTFEKNSTKDITGKMTFSFYIRGSHTSDQLYIFESLIRKQNEFEAEIKKSIESCKTSGTCSNIEKLENISKKFDELNRSFKTIYEAKKGNTLEAMYLLTQQIQSLKLIESEYKSIK